jgi:tetratricopeptide (TPR) repeat protein
MAAREKQQAETQRHEAEAQRQEAVVSLKDAQLAVDQLLSRVGRDRLREVPHMEPLRRELLVDALRFYQKFLQRTNADPELRLAAVRAYHNASAIQLVLGNLREAKESAHQGIALAEALLAQKRPWPELQQALADGWRRLGLVKLQLNRDGEAEEAFKKARDILSRLVTDQRNSDACVHGLAAVCDELGTTYARSGRFPQAEASYREAMRWGARVVAASPDNLSFQLELGHATASLGTLQAQFGKKYESLKLLRQAVGLHEKVVEQWPGPRQRATLAKSYHSLGIVQTRWGQLKEAAESQQKSLDLWSELRRDFPRVTDYTHYHARSLLFAGKARMDLGKDRVALAYLSNAERLYTQLAKDFPANQVYRQELALCCKDRGWLLAASYDAEVRQPAAAILPAKRAIELEPQDGMNWTALGMAYYRAGQWPEALQALNGAVKHARPDRRVDLFLLAMTHARLGHEAQARKWYEEAEAWRQKHAPNNPFYSRLGREAAQLLGTGEHRP